MKTVKFARAIFLSWYCRLGDCKFCYMSTQKKRIKEPERARRSLDSVLAEVLLSKKLGWNLEFVSVGYGAFDFETLLNYLKAIKKVWGMKLWLNIGYLDENQIKRLNELVEGIAVSVETVSWKLREELCPSKPLAPMLKTLKLCDKYKLKKAMTLILGLGESLSDFEELKKFIKKHKFSRITFYRLKPQKDTLFEGKKTLETGDYVAWVSRTRKEFPRLEILAGSWLGYLKELNLLLKAGADHLTKFPAVKMFGTESAWQIEAEVKNSGRKWGSSLTRLPKIDWEKEVKKAGLGPGVLKKVLEYAKTMEKNINKQREKV